MAPVTGLRPPHPIAVIGDVGGHAWMLRRCLTELGADPSAGTLPEDLAVVQVGNLVHKGPESAAVVSVVARMLTGAPGRWIQLVGNHEAQEGLGGPDFWAESLDDASRTELRRWVLAKQAALAVALDTVEYGPVLVTHAGLTRQKWEAIGEPDTPEEAAVRLNAELATHPERAFAAGEMLGVRPRLPVGVTWASPGELLSSWDMEQLPFSQVHGHANPRRWESGTWAPGVPRRSTARATADPGTRHCDVVWPDGGHMLCVHPDYGADAAPVPLVPLVMTGEVLR